MSKLLTPRMLVERWNISDNTLRKWRVAGAGPAYIKLGNRRNSEVRYRQDDIEEFEKTNRFVANK